MKKIAKKVVAATLGYQVKQLRRRNDFKIIGVVGSIGKTSTKLAIAQTLSAGFKVRYQDGNYNDIVSVPLVFFDEPMPSLLNPLAWLGLFLRNRKKLENYPYDIVVLELGSDAPGQIGRFESYLALEIGVITAITPEHMAFFDSLDEVAKEELDIGKFSSLVLANKDLCDKKYLDQLPGLLTYAIKGADYDLSEMGSVAKGKSEAEQYSLIAAAAAARKLGMATEDIKAGLAKVKPVPGRMQILEGVNGSVIIDDTYNASPAAVKLALDYLYDMVATKRIAVLGNMNEMGDSSKAAHEEIGAYCDPKKLDMVLTIGAEANRFLAQAAEAKGCKVQSFDSPFTAGEYLKPLLQKGEAVLIKGSQNGVFAEETVKILLANQADSGKLVRQSDDWLKVKQKAFKS